MRPLLSSLTGRLSFGWTVITLSFFFFFKGVNYFYLCPPQCSNARFPPFNRLDTQSQHTHSHSHLTYPLDFGGFEEHFFFFPFFFFYMGLNHYIGSLLNYRLLFLSQRHHAIFEALLRSRVWFVCAFFLSWQMCLLCTVSVGGSVLSEIHLTISVSFFT